MNTLKKGLYFALLALLITACAKEEDLVISTIDELESNIENRSEDPQEGACEWKTSIVEVMPSCYSSSKGYGQYKLVGLPDAKKIDIKWQVEHATIIDSEGDQVYVMPDSEHDYIVRAFIKLNTCPLKSEYLAFTPNADCAY